jgi:hypothetical protein
MLRLWKDSYRLAWTSTKKGMTERQKNRLRFVLTNAKDRIAEFHHGDCIGGDAEAHDIAADILGVDKIWIHPGSNPRLRAYKKSPHILPPDDNLDRNRTMVRICDGLLAAPETKEEVIRSGTWMTIREARDRQKKPFKILEP